jgi:hypothetical protein
MPSQPGPVGKLKSSFATELGRVDPAKHCSGTRRPPRPPHPTSFSSHFPHLCLSLISSSSRHLPPKDDAVGAPAGRGSSRPGKGTSRWHPHPLPGSLLLSLAARAVGAPDGKGSLRHRCPSLQRQLAPSVPRKRHLAPAPSSSPRRARRQARDKLTHAPPHANFAAALPSPRRRPLSPPPLRRTTPTRRSTRSFSAAASPGRVKLRWW